ncbi:MAG: glycosyltransferase [Gammaproteobacteria bacterium TMED112]|nr:MAG: glycosyltransferase [Gammaproteobacteria bacterium TMED112]
MNNLTGKKILLISPEFEKKEHRGIASYSKSLINTLNILGAEVWLSTSINPKNFKLNKFNNNSRDYIFTTYILRNFYEGNENYKNYFYIKNRYLKFLNKLNVFLNFICLTLKLLKTLFSSNVYNEKNCKEIKFINKEDNPYLRIEKLSFIKGIRGFVSLPNLSFKSEATSRFPFRNKMKINLNRFDYFISTAPINLITNLETPIIQTIHDLIPLEYEPNLSNLNSFYNKLLLCENSKRIFVSEITKSKFHHIFNNNKKYFSNKDKKINSESVIIQSPSLFFEEYKDFNIYNRILNSVSSNKTINANQIQPFNYFLFNASIDSRKNVLLLIECFLNSEAQRNGKILVITGKMKNDKYSKKIKNLIANNYGIISTGYIKEAFKSALYLNALCLLSPSIVEGFGIPVLDACCLGLNCFASDCNSHKEIQKLFDFSSYLDIYSPISVAKWTYIFNNKSIFNVSDKGDTILNRLSRYQRFDKKIKDEFKAKLLNLINED